MVWVEIVDDGIADTIIVEVYFSTFLQLIATGSSSFELANRLNEPLTGRDSPKPLPAPILNAKRHG